MEGCGGHARHCSRFLPRSTDPRAELSALEGHMREGAKILFNALGLGSCFALVRGS